MLSIILGVLAIGLGAKAFTAKGLPLSRTKDLTGTSAKVIGVLCILFGLLCFVDGFIGTMAIVSILSRPR